MKCNKKFAFFSQKVKNMLLCSYNGGLMNIYEKFKNNNLPTPFWDEKRKTLEYVNVGNRKTIFNFDKAENKIEIYTNLTKL